MKFRRVSYLKWNSRLFQTLTSILSSSTYLFAHTWVYYPRQMAHCCYFSNTLTFSRNINHDLIKFTHPYTHSNVRGNHSEAELLTALILNNLQYKCINTHSPEFLRLNAYVVCRILVALTWKHQNFRSSPLTWCVWLINFSSSSYHIVCYEQGLQKQPNWFLGVGGLNLGLMKMPDTNLFTMPISDSNFLRNMME